MSTHHLRYAGASPACQRKALETIIRESELLMRALEGMRVLDLPDPLIGSGAIYNTVWNVLSGRPPLTGIKDIDIIYCDTTDLSYAAEDRVIRAAAARLGHLPVPVEVRNQARVHLWFPERFGLQISPITRTAEALLRYAAKTHAVAIRLEADDSLTIQAPFGLDDIFSFRLVPNPALDNRKTYEEKAIRAANIWPELDIVPWAAHLQ